MSNNLVVANHKSSESYRAELSPTRSELNVNDEQALKQKEKPTIKITVASQEIIYLDSHKTLLACLESSDIEVHYHCRDGYCGACRVTLKSGDIHYPQGEPLAFVGEGEILPCCCIPIGDITIDVK